jgi:alkylation response protein AidB-like acyl-CoA dehydrogenase
VTTVGDPLDELFDEALQPMLRRLGARPKAGGGQPPEPADAEARAAVWATLTELGGLAPARFRDTLDARVAAAELMGPALYQSPYLDTMIAADLLRDDHPGLVEQIAGGERTVALALRERGTDEPVASPAPDLRDGLLHGVRRFVSFAADVDDLLIGGPRGYLLVPVRQSGVALRGHDDLGRGDLYEVAFTGAAVGARGGTASTWAWALARGRLQHAAYLAALAGAALEAAVRRVKERSAFGRPLAKLQAPAFRLAAYAAEVHAVRTLVRSAAAAEPADLALTAAQALFLAADLAVEVTGEAVHLHGAAGLTEEQDVSVFYRRAAVEATRLGSPTHLRLEASRMLAAAYDAAGPSTVEES